MPAWWSALKLLLGVAAVAAVLAALVPASGPAKALLAAKRQLDPDDPVAYCDEVLAQAAQQQANADLDKILGSDSVGERKGEENFKSKETVWRADAKIISRNYPQTSRFYQHRFLK